MDVEKVLDSLGGTVPEFGAIVCLYDLGYAIFEKSLIGQAAPDCFRVFVAVGREGQPPSEGVHAYTDESVTRVGLREVHDEIGVDELHRPCGQGVALWWD